MELRHLRHFVAVAEELHFSRAAKRARIEQSPLSRSIKNLESRLGVTLFERTRRSTRLTPAGERLLSVARSILAMADEARIDVRNAAQNGGVHLRIGVCDGVPFARLARLLAALRREDAGISVRVFEVPMVEKLAHLSSGFLDVALAPENGYGAGIIGEEIWHDPAVALLPKTHPLAGATTVELETIVSEPLIVFHPDTGLGHQSQIEQLVRSANKTPNIIESVGSICMLIMLVCAGFGVAVATDAQVEAVQTDDLLIRPFSEPCPKVATWLLHRAGIMPATLSLLVQLARLVQ